MRYARLRDAASRRLVGHPGGELALARHEADPQAERTTLERELALAGAEDDADLVAAALALVELADGGWKYVVPVSDSQGVQIGDHNVQVSYYFREPAGQQEARSAGMRLRDGC